MSEDLAQTLLQFYVAWHVGWDMVTPRDRVRALLNKHGYDLAALIAAEKARIAPQVAAWEKRQATYREEEREARTDG